MPSMMPKYDSQTSTNGRRTTSGDLVRTKILLLGQRRTGKTSILDVLFNDCGPKDTLYIERTTRVTKHTYDTVIPIEIWDCPGDITLEALEALDTPLSHFATIIFVMDIQDLYQPPITKLVSFVIAAYDQSPQTNLEVFVHKADALSEEYRIDNYRFLQQHILDELIDISSEYEQIQMNFALTSIHDHSLHDAFSRTLHKSIESLPYLEDLLNIFCYNSQSSKAFLFDLKSRLYVATDASPVDPPTHNLCSDYLLMLNSFGPLYSSHPSSAPRSPFLSSTRPSALAPTINTADDTRQASITKTLFYPSAGMTLTYQLITRKLALLAIIPSAVFEARRGLVEYNVVFFREGVQEICEVEDEARGGGG
ncbi:hypothetical protein IEO21_02686 [Rhodonia placenta]|uniref:GTP-binding protein n=1 Tax=Rhodonia placenta TaxID=104341 RepID=A0A8H7U4V7_9APHY|nr:hypothetical protein IEO21_02686 [Postia placenta]